MVSIFPPFAIICSIFVPHCLSSLAIRTETFYGEVGSSNYTYYRFNGGTDIELLLRLTTVEGDADLYVSGQSSQPTYELDQHHFQSTTCGEIDEVFISASFVRDERPLGIGVYGHPSHLLSKYVLHVIAREVDLEETNGYLEDGDQGYKSEEKNVDERLDDKDSRSLLSWEIVISLLAAIARILIDVLT